MALRTASAPCPASPARVCLVLGFRALAFGSGTASPWSKTLTVHVADGSVRVERRLANGTLDLEFGGGAGFVNLAEPGQIALTPSVVSVDAQSRIVVAGSANARADRVGLSSARVP